MGACVQVVPTRDQMKTAPLSANDGSSEGAPTASRSPLSELPPVPGIRPTPAGLGASTGPCASQLPVVLTKTVIWPVWLTPLNGAEAASVVPSTATVHPKRSPVATVADFRY